ncbi:MAG: glucan biosynthesis protein, partial [Pelovirga sp.]
MTVKRHYLFSFLLAGLIFLLPGTALAGAAKASDSFAFADVEKQARQMAQQAYVPPDKLPAILTELTYDEWRNIRQKRDKVLWAGDPSPFQLQFFHPGLFYDRTVKINI